MRIIKCVYNYLDHTRLSYCYSKKDKRSQFARIPFKKRLRHPITTYPQRDEKIEIIVGKCDYLNWDKPLVFQIKLGGAVILDFTPM